MRITINTSDKKFFDSKSMAGLCKTLQIYNFIGRSSLLFVPIKKEHRNFGAYKQTECQGVAIVAKQTWYH